MSRIGKKPVPLPAGVTATVKDREVKVKGPKGELSRDFPQGVSFNLEDGKVTVSRADDEKRTRAIHGRETVAEALGIDVPRAKLAAFVVSSTLTAVAGALFAYFRGFVSVEAFSLYLTIQYVAMVIIGGMGSVLGALLGTVFVVLFPHLIDGVMRELGVANRLASLVFAINYAGFGLVMLLFLVFEPQGLVGIWRRVQNWALLWPFKQRPLSR